jgi:hypothetical protein
MERNSFVDLKDEEQPSLVDELFENRDRFYADVSRQIHRRVNKFLYYTKKDKSHYALPKANEKAAYAEQVALNDMHVSSLQNRSDKMERQDQNNADFDKEAYYQLKEQLRQRKDAKERLLSQGLPEFKAYLRF